MKLSITPKELKEATRRLYPNSGYLTKVNELCLYYENRAMDITRQKLKLFAQDITPITDNILTRLIDTKHVSYDTPPTRIPQTEAGPLNDDHPTTRLISRILKESQFDGHWVDADAYRGLLGTVVSRTYVNEPRRSLAFRRFRPDHVFRKVAPGYEDDISQDEAFALGLANDTYELWQRHGEAWFMFIVDEQGEVLRKPFGDEGRCPYDILPVQLVHDQVPNGQAFSTLKESRLAYSENINRMWNCVPEMVDLQAFDQGVVTTSNPEDAKGIKTGPKTLVVLPNGATLDWQNRQPGIGPSIAAIEKLREQFAQSECIPIDVIKGSTSVQTGEAHRAMLWALKDQRDQSISLIKHEQLLAFDILRSVWNIHAPSWGKPIIPLDVTVEVTPVDTAIPIGEQVLKDVALAEIGAGLSSRIQYLMRKHGISRDEAIAMKRQIDSDNIVYDSPQAPLEGTGAAEGPSGDAEGEQEQSQLNI